MHSKLKINIFRLFFGFLLLSFTNLQAQSTSVQPATAEHEEKLLKEISRGFSRVAKKAIPAVVYIESDTTRQTKNSKKPTDSPFDYFHDEFFNRFFGFPQEERKENKREDTVRGSGFLVSANGTIITNNHVVENASKIIVTLHGGKKVKAEVLGTDPKTDLAVIKIDEKNLPYLTFGNSDTLEVGDWAIAVGNPFGLEASVTVGVVSAKGRSQLHITDFDDFIQTDAAINPGNSGGPLLNIHGEVIGINTAIVSGSGGYMGIGFAIPSSMAKPIQEQLINAGSVTRGFLGVTLQLIDEDLARYYKLDKASGALISDIVKGSPADVAGLKQEDIILSYNNQPLENLSGFRNTVAFMPLGTKIKLTIQREGKTRQFDVTIASAPKEDNRVRTSKLGFQVQPLNPELAKQFGHDNEKAGLVVTEVSAGSVAASVGLRPGSLILAINRKNISTVDEFDSLLNEALKMGELLLKVKEHEFTRFIALHLGAPLEN